MLSCTLYKNLSPVNKIGKNITDALSLNITMKDNCSVIDPLIRIQTSTDLSTYNYMYIPALSRYYFIKNIETVNNNIWDIKAHVDVLETYKTGILANEAVIKRQQGLYNLYLDDPEFHVLNYERIQTYKFPANTFSKALKYVLVVNGS